MGPGGGANDAGPVQRKRTHVQVKQKRLISHDARRLAATRALAPQRYASTRFEPDSCITGRKHQWRAPRPANETHRCDVEGANTLQPTPDDMLYNPHVRDAAAGMDKSRPQLRSVEPTIVRTNHRGVHPRSRA